MPNTIHFRPRRPRIHCSIDVLFHAGVLVLTRAIAVRRGGTVRRLGL